MSVVNRQKLSFYPYNVDLHTAMPFTSQSMGKNSLVWSVFVQSIQDFTDSHHPLSQVTAAFKLLSSILTSSLNTVLLVAVVKTTVWLFSQYVVFDIHVSLPSDVQLKPYPLRGTRGVGGGGFGWWTPPSPWVFDKLQYFETILPSVERLWSSLQDEVYFMGGGAAGGLIITILDLLEIR